MIIKPLVCVLSPRDIDIVKEGHNTFKHIPHLWLKYWSAIQAYHIIKDFFLNKPIGKQFTHLVISPDDLVVTSEHYKALLKTVEQEDYPVFSGVCNVDCAHPTTLNICIEAVPNIIRKLRRYHWEDLNKVKLGVIQVKFAGMPFTFMRRDVVEKVPLLGDTPYDPLRKGIEPTSFDSAFCWHCSQMGIPIHVDTRVKLLHLRGMHDNSPIGSQVSHTYVRKKRPQAYYQVDDKIQDFTDQYMKYIYELNPYGSNVYLKRFMKV
jgi:hypothetical protein